MRTFLVLNQYRLVSSYKDLVGELYHFPKRYLGKMARSEAQFLYYEPRDGGDQVYFGCGLIGAMWPDPENPAYHYAEILNCTLFPKPVSYWLPNGSTAEPARTMRNSVREISGALFSQLLLRAKVEAPPSQYIVELTAKYVGATPAMKTVLAKQYERPNVITSAVKKARGHVCQLCGVEGFLMRNGSRYCEVHHLFHVSRQLPGSLSPRQLIVVCANCHRMLHYANASDPEELEGRWIIRINERQFTIPILEHA